MMDPVTNVRTLFPTVQITLVSIIVALSLEQLLDALPEIDALWRADFEAARIWCQVLTVFAIIVKIWSGFVFSAVMRTSLPRAIDFLAPIGLLVFVDAQIATLGDPVLRWWIIIGLGSFLATVYLASQQGAPPPADASAWQIGMCWNYLPLLQMEPR